MTLVSVLLLSLLLGMTLGLVGGGGAVLGIPLLVYLADMPPEQAIKVNLLVIAIASLLGIWWGRKRGILHHRAIFLIGGMGALGAPLGASTTHHLSETTLMVAMITLMGLATFSIWRTRETESESSHVPPVHRCQWRRCALVGFTVGFLTGLLGVGGGVLLVPAMTILTKMPFRMASQTSMAITAINASVGFLSHLATPIELSFTAIYLLMVVAGMLAAQSFRHLMTLRSLKLYFSSMMTAAALLMLFHHWHHTY
jgi:uncharacterized membrane protein YfcA